jgi:general stress protein 26
MCLWQPQVAQFSSSAASTPQLYAMKLSQERKQQMEELQHMEPMRWEDIV